MSGGRDIRHDLRKKQTGGVELIAIYAKGHPGYHNSVFRRSRGEESNFSNGSYKGDHSSTSFLSTPSLGRSGFRNDSRKEIPYGKSMRNGTTVRDTSWYHPRRMDDSDEISDEAGPSQDTAPSALGYGAVKFSRMQGKHTKSNVSYDTTTIIPKYPIGRDIGLNEAALLWMKVKARRGEHEADSQFFQEEDEAGYDRKCAEKRYWIMREKVSRLEEEAFQRQRRSAYQAEKDGEDEDVEGMEESLMSLNMSGIDRWRSVTSSSSSSQSGLGPCARSTTRGSRYGATWPPYRAKEGIFSLGPALSDEGSICPEESISNIGMPRSCRRK